MSIVFQKKSEFFLTRKNFVSSTLKFSIFASFKYFFKNPEDSRRSRESAHKRFTLPRSSMVLEAKSSAVCKKSRLALLLSQIPRFWCPDYSGCTTCKIHVYLYMKRISAKPRRSNIHEIPMYISCNIHEKMMYICARRRRAAESYVFWMGFGEFWRYTWFFHVYFRVVDSSAEGRPPNIHEFSMYIL